MNELACKFVQRYADFTLRFEVELKLGNLGIFGPSGSGKTTILECLTGLVTPVEGRIRFGGDTWFDSDGGIDRPTHQRDVGYLMQEAPLFPHRTVEENIFYGANTDQRSLADRAIKILEIGDLLNRSPRTLSGGERRRVALAQVLASNSRLLLLDEPLIGLNETLRKKTLPAIRRVIEELNLSTIVVSHRPEIIRALADTIVPLRNGRGGEVYSTRDFFRSERLREEDVLGDTNYFEVEVVGRDDSGLLETRTNKGLAFRLLGGEALQSGDRAIVSFSVREPILGNANYRELSPRNHWTGQIKTIKANGESHLVSLEVNGEVLRARVTKETVEQLGLSPGKSVGVLLKTHSLDVQPV